MEPTREKAFQEEGTASTKVLRDIQKKPGGKRGLAVREGRRTRHVCRTTVAAAWISVLAPFGGWRACKG